MNKYITKEDIKQIADELYEESLKAIKEDEIPISACLLFDYNGTKKIISHNKTKSDNTLAHAEISVINEALNITKTAYLDNASLFVTLEPCVMCMGAILKSNIKTLYYFVDNKIDGSLSYYHLHVDDKIKVITMDDERFIKLLQDFFKGKR